MLTDFYICNLNEMMMKNLLFKPLYGQQITRDISKHIKSYSKGASISDGLVPIKMSYSVYENGKHSDEPPVVIMHGVLGSKNNWNSLAKALHSNTKLKVISVDARDHGDSPHTDQFSYELMAADVIHLLDSLSVERACLIGHSMGGRSMMKVALTYPKRVKNLIVVDMTPTTLKTTLTIQQYFDVLERISLDDSLPLSQGRRLADSLISDHVPEVGIRQFLLTNLTKVDNKFTWKANMKGLKRNFNNILEFPLRNEVFNEPALFIGGMKSDYLRKEDHSKILQHFPLAKFEYLDTGHWVHAEQPHEFLRIATDFILSAR